MLPCPQNAELSTSGREGPMCNKKIKCNLLAAVLILTVLPTTVAIGKPIIEHCCFIISQKLVEGSEVRRGLPLTHLNTHFSTSALFDCSTLCENSHHGFNIREPNSAAMRKAIAAWSCRMSREGGGL